MGPLNNYFWNWLLKDKDLGVKLGEIKRVKHHMACWIVWGHKQAQALGISKVSVNMPPGTTLHQVAFSKRGSNKPLLTFTSTKVFHWLFSSLCYFSKSPGLVLGLGEMSKKTNSHFSYGCHALLFTKHPHIRYILNASWERAKANNCAVLISHFTNAHKCSHLKQQIIYCKKKF